MDILHDLVGYELVDVTFTENVFGADELWIEREDGTEYCIRATHISYEGDPSKLIDSEIQITKVYSDFVQISSLHGVVTIRVYGLRSCEVY